jgi:hypothetical protein
MRILLALLFALVPAIASAGNCGLINLAATPAQIAAHPNMVSRDLTLQSATATSATLSALDRQTVAYYVGATLDVPGHGSQTITAYSNFVATLSGSWTSTPPAGAPYTVTLPGAAPGVNWHVTIEPWSHLYKHARGFQLVVKYDRSAAGDCSDLVTIARFAPTGGIGQNADDGEIQFYANVLGLTSVNDLTAPRQAHQWNPSSTTVATGPSHLDIGPQIAQYRAVPNPLPGSHLGNWPTDGQDHTGTPIIYHYMQTVVEQPQGGWARFLNWPGRASYPFVCGGVWGGGCYFQDGNLRDAGPGTIHTRGSGVNWQWLNVP